MIYIGIDPGIHGAMAIIRDNNQVEIFMREDNNHLEALTLAAQTYGRMGHEKAVCCLESPPLIPKNGKKAVRDLFQDLGYHMGMLEALRIPYELVTPQKWKKAFSVTADKNTSILVAQRLFPDVDLRRTERCRKPDDNRAEALLMAEYARRELAK